MLRARLTADQRIDFAELVVLGAEVKARRLSAQVAAGAAARERLAEMIRARSIPVDLDAATEAKRLKLAPSDA